MQYIFKGPGKYILGYLSSPKVRKAIIGELVELTAKQYERFKDRFEPVPPQPTEEEIAAQEAARQEATEDLGEINNG